MRILQADVVKFLCDFIRAELRRLPDPFFHDVEVAAIEPDVAARDYPDKLVTVAVSTVSDADLHLSDVSVRVNYVAGTPEFPDDCVKLARMVHAIVRDCARVADGNPVAAVTASRGAMSVVDEQLRARWFSLFDLVVVGTLVP
ncbi:hypothetical protein [Leucobacter sp. OH1287]|uniref:hypothetical protein n=1 Tax=Leucobacter sp. OH1287 TaxID=2491049 RepID=UPI000F5FDD80|nr:hypothetical protein [Leucobacter sp. OH1287]RRD61631.1 hypothetical protein EII30_02045 [Leucobacter sp. OH1287]